MDFDAEVVGAHQEPPYQLPWGDGRVTQTQGNTCPFLQVPTTLWKL